YGWHFVGRKRRENYDDWWRCEVSFDPALDEYFGLTHSKQAISPTPEIQSILVPDVEATAHKLNARVRAGFTAARARTGRAAEERARARELQLPPLRQDGVGEPGQVQHWTMARRHGRYGYRLAVRPLAGRGFYSCEINGREIVVTINREHPFFEKLYQPLVENGARSLARRLECLMLALG